MDEIIPTRQPTSDPAGAQVTDWEEPFDHLPVANPSVDDSKSRVFSAQRMKYSAEVRLIKNKWGDLEAIRKTLGLSQRKMCQLLFVDPSAWTRWTKQSPTQEPSAPPHIYRALSWFLTLQEKHPELSPYHWLQTVAQPQMPAHEIQGIKSRLESGIVSQFEERLRNKERQLKLLLIANISTLVLGITLTAIFLLNR